MSLNTEKNLKMYYSIKEVSAIFSINESTLRYWETEFPFLRPKTKGTSKIRQYTADDIEQIRAIHNLVKVRGFKLSAARKLLATNREGVDKTTEVLSCLQRVRDELMNLKKQVDSLT